MREFAPYGFIVFISVVGLIVMALPIVAWARKRAWR